VLIRKKRGNFLEDFRVGQLFRHKVGKTVTEGLFNAFTEALKGNLDALPRRTQALHGLLDAACGLAASRN